MIYNKLLKDIEKTLEKTNCNFDFFNYNSTPNLTTIVEDSTSLVLTLKHGYIYFNVDLVETGKIILTYHKFDINIVKQSETRMTFYSYDAVLDKILNVVIYNSNKPTKKR